MESVNTLGYVDGCKTAEFIKDIELNGSSYVSFACYSPCYKFSNENLNGYYHKFNINNGRVLTVCGSGDQVLSSILYGAKEVDCFDSNRVAYYNLMLKMYSIKHLDYETFLDFFGISGKHVEKKSIYYKLRDCIDNKNIKYFFDVIFDDDFNISYLYNLDCDRNDVLFSMIPYLNSNNYYKLRDMIDNCKVTFKQSDLFDIFNHFDGKYDFINFSNIFSYVNDNMRFCCFIEKIKYNHLTQNGGIMINYSWTKPHYSYEVNRAAQDIGAYQLAVPTCDYSINVDSDSIMYYGSIKN